MTMIKSKILFIGFKRQRGSIPTGGNLANMRSLNTIKKFFGTENVGEYYILDEAQKRPIWSYLLAVLLFPFNYHNGLTPQKIKDIISISKDYNYIFLSTSVIAIVAKKLRENGYQGTIVTHYHNIESIYYDAIIPRWFPGRQIIVRCAANNDKYGCEYSSKVITLSERDSKFLEKHYGRKADAIISISLEDNFSPIDESQLTSKRPLCLFIGTYNKPNNNGVLFFVKNVLPFVDIEFKVVGKGMGRLKNENDSMKDIEVINDAPDLRPFFNEADFMILPVFSGSGMKVKTCESLMYGKNIIGSSETFEGYHVDTNKVGGLCNTADEYIRCLKHYINHPIPRFNKYSREIFISNNTEKATETNFFSIFIIF